MQKAKIVYEIDTVNMNRSGTKESVGEGEGIYSKNNNDKTIQIIKK